MIRKHILVAQPDNLQVISGVLVEKLKVCMRQILATTTLHSESAIDPEKMSGMDTNKTPRANTNINALF